MSLFTTYPANLQGRDFVVGDIHGCKQDLFKALRALDFDFDKDRLFSVGDLIDRGPESLEMLKLLATAPWFIPVQGNHEQMFLDAMDEVPPTYSHSFEQYLTEYYAPALQHFVRQGGQWVCGHAPASLWPFISYLKTLPAVIKVNTRSGTPFFLAHAGLYKCVPFQDRWTTYTEKEMEQWSVCPRTVLWTRDIITHVMRQPMEVEDVQVGETTVGLPQVARDPRPAYLTGKPLTYVGHTPLPCVSVVDNVVYLDTGAFLQYFPEQIGSANAKLTIMEHEQLKAALDNHVEQAV